ncbi:MAG: homoserine kinase [Chloroflexi bacterium]|nr:homoserine kinase [Chloroflexota bacterium]
MIRIRVPATSANLGPGFDCLGLALNLWNEVTFEGSDETTYTVTGEGQEKLNHKPRNLLIKSYRYLHEVCSARMTGVSVKALNRIPVGSGLGSSASAIVAGLAGANAMLKDPLAKEDLLELANELEGHPDNVAAALYGGLVISVVSKEEILTQRFDLPELTILIVIPEVTWPTRMARAVLPKSYSRNDAIFNIGRSAMVVNALREGDLDLLQRVMDDRIHQPYRLKHIDGGLAAYNLAKSFGAVALSGAGPSLIVFLRPHMGRQAISALTSVFEDRRIAVKSMILKPSNEGVQVV